MVMPRVFEKQQVILLMISSKQIHQLAGTVESDQENPTASNFSALPSSPRLRFHASLHSGQRDDHRMRSK